MGTRITCKGADFESVASGYLPVVSSGLEYLNFFTSDAVRARNLAPGKPVATVVGDPAVTAGWMTVTHGANYIQTGALLTPDHTFFAVSRQQTEAQGAIVGNFVAVGTAQSQIYWTQGALSDGLVRINSTMSVNNGGAISASVYNYAEIAHPTGPEAIGFRYLASSRVRTLNRFTAGAVGTSTLAYPLATPNSTAIRIGHGLAGSTEIAAVAVYSRHLSDIESNTLYASIKAFLATRSITC